MQAQANSEETVFVAKTEGTDLKFFLGDSSTHAGNFVFPSKRTRCIKHRLELAPAQVLSILSLPGDITMKFSDAGAAMITVDSGMASYDYISSTEQVNGQAYKNKNGLRDDPIIWQKKYLNLIQIIQC